MWPSCRLWQAVFHPRSVTGAALGHEVGFRGRGVGGEFVWILTWVGKNTGDLGAIFEDWVSASAIEIFRRNDFKTICIRFRSG
jgi:hypothetical protein